MQVLNLDFYRIEDGSVKRSIWAILDVICVQTQYDRLMVYHQCNPTFVRNACTRSLSFSRSFICSFARMQALVPQWGPKVRTTRHRWFDKCVSCVCARETLILCKFQLEKIYSSRKYYPRKLRFSFATRLVFVVVVISIPFPFQFSVPANCSECIFIHCSMWSDATNTTYNKKMEKNACDNLEKRTIK